MVYITVFTKGVKMHATKVIRKRPEVQQNYTFYVQCLFFSDPRDDVKKGGEK